MANFKKYNQRPKLLHLTDLQITKLHGLGTLQVQLLLWSTCLAFHSSIGHMKSVKNGMLHTCTDKTMTLLHFPTVPRLYSMGDYSSHVNKKLAFINQSTSSKSTFLSTVIMSIFPYCWPFTL